MSALGFQIFSDGAENQHAGIRKTKRDEASGKPPATKRAALGVISNNNNTRVQPLRAVKQSHPTDSFGALDSENVQPKQAKTFGSFAIHVDSQASQQTSQARPTTLSQGPDKLSLHSGITGLRGLQQINEPILIDDDSPFSKGVESPMLLDTSIVQCRTEQDTAESRMEKILTVPEYSEDIYKYLRECELRYRAKPGYMKKQPDINTNMRCILVDWLVEVAEEYRVHRETLFLSVNYIDRFLSQMSVLRGKLQLVGAACMFLASKYEEIYPPEVGEFVYITDDTYTKKQVLKMENLILKVLSFDVAAPTINLFCERFLKHSGYTEDDQAYNLTMMLAEMTLVDAETYGNFVPSQIAASCLCMANHALRQTPWSEDLTQHTGYSMSELNACVQALYHTFAQSPQSPQQAIRDKYKLSKFKEVALICPPSLMPSGCTPIQQSPVV